jgi:hypothetical protein
VPTVRLNRILGAVSRLRDDDARMQPGENGMYVRKVENGYITDDGAIVALPSTQTLAAGTWSAKVSTPAGLVVHNKDAGTLVLDPHTGSPTTLVSGLATDQDAVLQEHQGLLYWWCGDDRGRITQGGVNLPWALPQAPAPTVSAIAGTMPAATYLVTVVWVDSAGAVSGCAPSASVTLASPGGLRITPISVPAEATQVRVFISPPNGEFPTWVEDRAVGGTWPMEVTTAPDPMGLYADIIPDTMSLSPLPIGDGMTTRGGFLVVWSGSTIWFGSGEWSHLHNPARHLFVLPEPIQGCVGVDGGLWVTTARRAFWIDGADLVKARITPVSTPRKYAAGGTLFPAEFSGLQTGRDAAAFVSDEGPVFGTADGQLVAPMRETQLWDVDGKAGRLVPFEYNGDKLYAVEIS